MQEGVSEVTLARKWETILTLIKLDTNFKLVRVLLHQIMRIWGKKALLLVFSERSNV